MEDETNGANEFGADFNDLFGTNSDGEEAASFMPQQTEDFVQTQEAPQVEEAVDPTVTDPVQSEPPPMEVIPPSEPKSDIMAELFGADDDDEEEDGVTMQDLFGADVDDDDDLEEPSPAEAAVSSTMVALEAAASAKPPQKRKVFRRICPEGEKLDVKIHPCNKPEGDAIAVRMPNIVSMEAENFDVKTYQPPQSSEKSSFIRWRIVYDAKDPTQPFKESNSRLVTWSDGSKSIVIGSEYFDVQETSFKTGEHFLFSSSVLAEEAEEEESKKILLGHGAIESRYHVKSVTTRGVHGEISQAEIARNFLRSNKARQITVGQKVAMLRDERAHSKVLDANSRANRKRKRISQRQERAKQRKMTEEFLETGANEINPDDMDTDEEDYSNMNQGVSSRTQVQDKLTNLVGASNTGDISDSDEEEEEVQRFKLRKNHPNSKIIDDSDDSD